MKIQILEPNPQRAKWEPLAKGPRNMQARVEHGAEYMSQ